MTVPLYGLSNNSRLFKNDPPTKNAAARANGVHLIPDVMGKGVSKGFKIIFFCIILCLLIFILIEFYIIYDFISYI